MKDLLLLTHFSGLIIGAGSAFALFVIGFLSKNFPEESRNDILLRLFPLRYISYFGLILLVASGVPLLTPFGESFSHMPLVMLKLLAVSAIVLLSLFGTVQMRQARNGNVEASFRRLGIAGKLSFALSLVVVGCAVYAFH